MSPRVVVESVSSSSLLRRSLSPGDAETLGEYDGKYLVVDSGGEAEELIEKYPNVHCAETKQETQQASQESPRLEVTNEGADTVCGVNGCSRTVNNPDDSCWQHE